MKVIPETRRATKLDIYGFFLLSLSRYLCW